jgi:hypothetical protein
VPLVLKYEKLILLEPSGSVQACNGIALALFAAKAKGLLSYALCGALAQSLTLTTESKPNNSRNRK